MSRLPVPQARRLGDDPEDRPLQGGLTGFALVALASLFMCLVGGALVIAAFLLVG